MINVVVIENNNTFRDSLIAIIDNSNEYKCSGSFRNYVDFLKCADALSINVILLDIGNTGDFEINGIKEIKKVLPNIDILLLTVYEDKDYIFEALRVGACGYIVKTNSAERILESIKDICCGCSPMSSNIACEILKVFEKTKSNKLLNLSEKEQNVLKILAEGNNYKEIAEKLQIDIPKVREYLRNIYRKLHVHSNLNFSKKNVKSNL